jgi:hypothetical protein
MVWIMVAGTLARDADAGVSTAGLASAAAVRAGATGCAEAGCAVRGAAVLAGRSLPWGGAPATFAARAGADGFVRTAGVDRAGGAAGAVCGKAGLPTMAKAALPVAKVARVAAAPATALAMRALPPAAGGAASLVCAVSPVVVSG